MTTAGTPHRSRISSPARAAAAVSPRSTTSGCAIPPLLRDAARDAVEFVAAPGEQHDRCSGEGEACGGLGADAAGGSRHDDQPPLNPRAQAARRRSGGPQPEEPLQRSGGPEPEEPLQRSGGPQPQQPRDEFGHLPSLAPGSPPVEDASALCVARLGSDHDHLVAVGHPRCVVRRARGSPRVPSDGDPRLRGSTGQPDDRRVHRCRTAAVIRRAVLLRSRGHAEAPRQGAADDADPAVQPADHEPRRLAQLRPPSAGGASRDRVSRSSSSRHRRCSSSRCASGRTCWRRSVSSC